MPELSGHGKIVCSCGALIAQCRCIEVRKDSCEKCRKSLKANPVEVSIDEYRKRTEHEDKPPAA